MAKRKKAPLTENTVQAAIASAKDGKGRPLAQLISSFSVEDLALGTNNGEVYRDWDRAWFMLELILNCASAAQRGREDWRREWQARLKAMRKEEAAKAKAARIEVDARRSAEAASRLADTISAHASRVLEPA
jgi:hypothetical protein